MFDSHQDKLRKRLERMPASDPPSPWSIVGGASVGGLTEIGFVPGSDDLLVVSSQGRGLFDTLTGEKLTRDSEEFFDNPDETGMTAPAIGRHDGITVPVSGLNGGGLPRFTRDGWTVDVIQLPWPRHVLFLTSNYNAVTDETGHVWKLCNDEPCSYRAAGFSPSGRSLVFATSGELVIYGRAEAEQ